ncbi:hypothetical protein PRK78_006709 [Emydomyces testavorans]|uniref:Rhomboid family membrane protein n=1 Tax=Emydomyces testavorans TaxID=2070801 RepID=A0AAF0DMX0_9EURO|nr:hypothetical protein PRK78_006709 [Emydomyces testavorans]
MSTSNPNPNSSTPSPPRHSTEYHLFKRYASLTFLIAAPILIALPPRKLDLYTASLASAFLFSANHLTFDQTGTSIVDRLGARLRADHASPRILRDLPTQRAEEVREQMRRAREAARRREGGGEQGGGAEAEGWTEIGRRIWMGGEEEGWRQRRMEEERKALEEGKGYGGLIMDHVRDAMGMGRGGSDGENTTERDADS